MKENSKYCEELKEGDVDPSLGKVVKFLILQTDRFAVYIDENLEIQWHHSDELKTDSDFGYVLNRVAVLEGNSRFIDDVSLKLSIRRQIAEGIARYLDYSSQKLSKEIHDIVDRQIRELNIKTSWGWYFNAAYIISSISMVSFMLIWVLRDFIAIYIGRAGVDVVLGGLIGAVGAIISVISRGNKICLDANAGQSIHQTEGIARVIVGMAGASLAALAYKGGLLFAGVKFMGSQMAVLLALSIIAGASERFVPSLVGKVELAISKSS